MAISCTINKRQNNINPTQEAVYHLKPVVNHTVDIDALSQRISARCSLTQADVVACLNALNHELMRALLDGDKVDMAWMGTFKIALQTKAQLEPRLCSKNDIKRFSVNYQPSTILKKKLQSQARISLSKDALQRYDGNG